jgi:cytochrome c biogenesis protein CcmG/thiol:disulfide interchange protein DsbE
VPDVVDHESSAPVDEREAVGVAGAIGGRRSRIAPFVALAVAVGLGALFVVLAGSDTGRNESVSSFLIDKPAPATVGTTLDGDQFDLSRRKGSWVVLNFFDPTCVPCVNEHPELVAFHAQQSGVPEGAELYTIVNAGSDESVAQFFADNGGDWPVVTDPDGSISVAFGVAQVPETWIIDPNGVVMTRIAGEVTAEGLSTEVQRLRDLSSSGFGG